MDEAWAKRLKENPVVWAPHRPYGKFSSTVGPEGPGCCEFPADHEIHVSEAALLAAKRREILHEAYLQDAIQAEQLTNGE